MSSQNPPITHGYLSAVFTGTGFTQSKRLTPMPVTLQPGQFYAYMVELPYMLEQITKVQVMYQRLAGYDSPRIMINRLTIQQNNGEMMKRSFCGSDSTNILLTTGYWAPLARIC